jgi:hypothetical protein
MQTLQVTLGSGATQISREAIAFQYIVFQNNSTHAVRIGDALVTATRGMLIAAGGGSETFSGLIDYGTFLSEWWLFGTAGDVIDILFIQ